MEQLYRNIAKNGVSVMPGADLRATVTESAQMTPQGSHWSDVCNPYDA